MTSTDQMTAERLECKPWCSPKHYRFCGGPCCPHLHAGDVATLHELPDRPARGLPQEPDSRRPDGKDASRDPARPTGRTRAGV